MILLIQTQVRLQGQLISRLLKMVTDATMKKQSVTVVKLTVWNTVRSARAKAVILVLTTATRETAIKKMIRLTLGLKSVSGHGAMTDLYRRMQLAAESMERKLTASGACLQKNAKSLALLLLKDTALLLMSWQQHWKKATMLELLTM